MLTRLKVDGFKNLIGVDIQFGPFTCIAGANGVGKSNLFDAIHFLSDLASKPLLEAALSVRNDGENGDVRELFQRVGSSYRDHMRFEAEMIVPRLGVDDLGERAIAKDTYLRYTLVIGYRPQNGIAINGGLEILQEELRRIETDNPTESIGFTATPEWITSAIVASQSGLYLSTNVDGDGETGIERYPDGQARPAYPFSARKLQKTVLSTTNGADMPTLLMARREMQSWRLLQLEPAALRLPDAFTSQPGIGSSGSHLPVTLYSLAGAGQDQDKAEQAYSHVANQLHDLLPDVRSISIDRDDQRRLLTLQVTGRDGTTHPARALSDGTLRFLALSTIAADTSQSGVICLEEPENGIHPERIRAMLSLLRIMATDTSAPLDENNPLRQVIVNTHSPTLVSEILDEELVIAEQQEGIQSGKRFQQVVFKGLSNTWRGRSSATKHVSKARLLAYLNPITPREFLDIQSEEFGEDIIGTRIVDRPDFRPLISPKI